MSAPGNNRLPVLAADIRAAHAGVIDAAKTAAGRAIEAGRDLIEAKSLLKHGQWLPWLKEHVGFSDRTAQLYMRIAQLGLESATVADLGLQAAAKVLAVFRTENYNPFAGRSDSEIRDWHVFILFLVGLGWPPEGAFRHVEWLLQRPFSSVGEWLGGDGQTFRRRCGMRQPPPTFVGNWRDFLEEHEALTTAECDAELRRIAGIIDSAGERE